MKIEKNSLLLLLSDLEIHGIGVHIADQHHYIFAIFGEFRNVVSQFVFVFRWCVTFCRKFLQNRDEVIEKSHRFRVGHIHFQNIFVGFSGFIDFIFKISQSDCTVVGDKAGIIFSADSSF